MSVSERTFAKEVLESSTLVLVDFWTPWCSLCRTIEPLLSRLQAEWSEQIKLVRINADENFKLANEYRLTTLPTLLLFDRGQLCDRLDSFQDEAQLKIALERIMGYRP